MGFAKLAEAVLKRVAKLEILLLKYDIKFEKMSVKEKIPH